MLSLLFPACNDYDLQAEPKPVEDTEEDTGFTADTAADTDTAEPIDTGSDTEVEDTGEPDPEIATEPVYLNTGSTLYSYDPTTNTASEIGKFKAGGGAITDMTDIGIDLTGHMYGCAYDVLYSVNPTTAEVKKIGNMRDDLNALTFVSDGRLVGAGTEVWFVDTANGSLTSLMSSGRYASSGDIIGLPDGMLYWTVEGGDNLVRIDPNNGKGTDLGSIGVQDVFALGYAYGELYGFTDGGQVVTIDSSSAKATAKDKLSGVWWGATTNPVLW